MGTFFSIFTEDKLKHCKVFYTDGSKNQKDIFGGFAIHASESEFIKRRSANYASIYTIEAMAILETLLYIKNNNINLPCVIFSDSKSVLVALKST